ncbi:MAG: CocE/NonD family hydrolase [Methanobacterium sp.]|nr:CocE/NonD family hydrolase [Methanobacterium sp.]
MSTYSRLMAKFFKFPPAETHDIKVEKDLKIPMPDGAVLLANRYYPHKLGKRPTILICSVYNTRTSPSYSAISIATAEQGFNVVAVNSRGSFGSTGDFDPFFSEQKDAPNIIEWLKKQEWFNGELCSQGASYYGYSQWPIAGYAGQLLKAMSTQATGSNFRDMVYSGDTPMLEVFLFWMDTIESMHKNLLASLIAYETGPNKRTKVAKHLPLGELDTKLVGHKNKFWTEWLNHNQEHENYWKPGDNSSAVSITETPNHMVSGWHDFFLPPLIKDYNTQKGNKKAPYLTIGPWTHAQTAQDGGREGMIWLNAHMLNRRDDLREAPVCVFVMGSSNEWREYSTWPPENMKIEKWYLQPKFGLTTDLPVDSMPDNYVYDPANPTPSVGGAATGKPVYDNRELESRPDVLSYTSNILGDDMELIGPVSAELFVKSSLEYTDFFVKICDVDPSGKSLNVCDGIQRLFPERPSPQPDGTIQVTVNLWPTAYRFMKGHKIRVQISSGAFPRFARNLGTDEPLATATKMKVANQSIFHDPEHPSTIFLPIIKGS